MKKLGLIIAGIYISIALVAQCVDESKVYSFEFDGKNYEVIQDLQVWDTAAACAKERGGYLVAINSQEEQDAVYDAIINGAGVSDTYVQVLDGGAIAYVWIGATDKIDEGKWLWDGDDDKIGFNFWRGQGANGANDGFAVEEAYVNWGGTGQGAVQEPDNYGVGQDFAAMGLAGWPKGSNALGDVGEWNDIEGTNWLYYVVEYEPVSNYADPVFENFSEEGEIKIYPNPSRGILNVEARSLQRVEIFDMTGQNMGTYTRSPILTDQFEKGLYLVKVVLDKRTVTRKLLVE